MSLRRLAGERGTDRDFVYLLMFARKYGLEPSALHHALVKAKENKESKCGSLSIALRERGETTVSFMFSQNNRAVAQAVLSERSLAKLRMMPPEFRRLLKNADRQFTAIDCVELERRIAHSSNRTLEMV